MAALQAEAERQGKTVSEIASEAIQEWIDPTPWFGPDGEETPTPSTMDMEPDEADLPKEGETYLGVCEGGHFPVKVISVHPLYKPVVPPLAITLSVLKEEGSDEWEDMTIAASYWTSMVEVFSPTLESVSNPGFTGVTTNGNWLYR